MSGDCLSNVYPIRAAAFLPRRDSFARITYIEMMLNLYIACSNTINGIRNEQSGHRKPSLLLSLRRSGVNRILWTRPLLTLI